MKTEISRAGDETGIFLHLFISKKLFGIFIIFGNIPTSNTVNTIIATNLDFEIVGS